MAFTLKAVRGSQGRVLGLQKYVRGNYGRVLQRGRVDPHDASKCVRGSAQGGEGSAKNEDKTAFFSFAFPRSVRKLS